MDSNLKSIRSDQGVFKVILFASLIIFLSILLVGSVVYFITEKEVVKKLKEKDLIYIAGSVASKIDGRIERAKESSLLLANDPEIVRWVAGGETDAQAGEDAVAKIQKMAKEFDYSNAFIVSSLTNHYWAENGQIIGTMSRDSKDDEWFFKGLASGRPVTVQLDYNAQRKDTFTFVNVLIGSVEHPLGITGVGMSLKGLSDEITQYKYGQKSSLWLIDETGKIHLSDKVEHDGMSIGNYLPEQVRAEVMAFGRSDEEKNAGTGAHIVEYTDDRGELIDLISYPIKSSANWRLLFQVPRSETVSFLNTIKYNAIGAAVVSMIAIIFIFYYVSTRLANPYKRALLLNEELERKVDERTRELFEQKQKLVDSIDYAKRIQEAILPSKDRLDPLWSEHFLLWNPRDTVGGDFYWVKTFREGYLVAVGDCTGHGVPGAFMTMVSVTILNQITNEANKQDPASILRSLNRRIKQTLQQEREHSWTDDGLDIALCYVQKDGKLSFAGAKSTLYVAVGGKELRVLQGDRKSVGYQRTDNDYPFTNNIVEIKEGDAVYMVTDGFIDQNGGSRNYAFGKKKFIQLLQETIPLPMAEQERQFRLALADYMSGEPQRDDITLLGFKV